MQAPETVILLWNRQLQERLAYLCDQLPAVSVPFMGIHGEPSLTDAIEPFLKVSTVPEAGSQAQVSYVLCCDEAGLALQCDKVGRQPLRVDFLAGTMNYRLQQNVRNELLVKAVLGRKKQEIPSVLDATAGLGGDSALLGMLGCHVTLVERNPVVALLLLDGLVRLSQSADPEHQLLSQRLSFYWGQFQSLRGHDWAGQAPDVVYLDPMFPEREKSAQVKKAMQGFKDVVGADNDSDELLPQAMQLAAKRVVVKRSAKAPFLASRKPTHSLTGRSSRFDVYQCG